MQILDTEIHAGPEGVLVEFFGEGGEKSPSPRLSPVRNRRSAMKPLSLAPDE